MEACSGYGSRRDHQKAEKERSHMMEILDLALEIIYLLTGEDYKVVKRTSGDHVTLNSCSHASEGWSKSQSRNMVPPRKNNSKKILEVTQKIIELLTGEVPRGCQDVSVNISMEEWEYLGGHRDLYKDVMMENEPPLTSPDGSSKRNPPERCPRPLYSRDSTQEHHEIPQQDQNETRTKCEEEAVDKERHVRGDEPCKEEEAPPEISTAVGWETSKSSDFYLGCKSEDGGVVSGPSTEINIAPEERLAGDGNASSEGKPPISNPGLLSTRLSLGKPPNPNLHPRLSSAHLSLDPATCGGHTFENTETFGSSEDQPPNPNLHPRLSSSHLSLDHTTYGRCPLKNLDTFSSSEDKPPNLHPRLSSSHLSLDPATSGGHPFDNTETFGSSEDQPPNPNLHPRLSSSQLSLDPTTCGRRPFENRNTFGSSEANPPNPNLHPRLPSAPPPLDPPTCGGNPLENTMTAADPRAVDALFVCSGCVKWFLLKLPPAEYQTINSHKIPFLCPDCGKRITQDTGLHRPRKADKETFECSECGKRFGFNSELIRHRLTHTGEKPYQCVECGKRFRQRGSLREHQKMHYGDKPFSCSECGSCFTRKIFLLNHQRTHTGEKPFSCSECGRCFAQEAVLIRHQVVHTGVKPYTCVDCGKSFAHRSSFMTHRRIHTGFEPYPCSECGKRFKQKSYLVDHFRLHTGEKPYGCAECGERFTRRLFLRKHEQVHTGMMWFPCLDCGKKFTEKRLLNRHQKIHSAEKTFTGPPESQTGVS